MGAKVKDWYLFHLLYNCKILAKSNSEKKRGANFGSSLFMYQ